jgi:peptide-methionine (S)-S-oxide reductase
MSDDGHGKTRKATFAAGCFWGVESTFRRVKGVISAEVGYAGGNAPSPTYHDVCTGLTGHAESVQVEYDPSVVSYDELLDVFWNSHDPTTLNRQGPDLGSQYRSAIFFHDAEQEAAARASKERLAGSGRLRREIVTQIVPAEEWHRAEEYHQRYDEKHGRH